MANNKEEECTCTSSSTRKEMMSCKRRHDSVILMRPSRHIKPSPKAILDGLQAACSAMEEFPSSWVGFCESVANLDEDKRHKAYLSEAMRVGIESIQDRLNDSREQEEHLLRIANRNAIRAYKAMRQEEYNRLRLPEEDKRIADLEVRVASEDAHNAD